MRSGEGLVLKTIGVGRRWRGGEVARLKFKSRWQRREQIFIPLDLSRFPFQITGAKISLFIHPDSSLCLYVWRRSFTFRLEIASTAMN